MRPIITAGQSITLGYLRSRLASPKAAAAALRPGSANTLEFSAMITSIL
jgi:hypothetical protein